METITNKRLSTVIAIYQNGVANWFRDKDLLSDCAYYEGAIDKACEVLNIAKPYTHISVTESLHEAYNRGYKSFWK